MNVYFVIVCVFSLSSLTYASLWPVPYSPLPGRPVNDPYCQAGLQAFCPSGKTVDSMPSFDPSDTIEVFALKKPVWSFKYGPLLGYFNVWHDGLGFRSQKTGLNYTMEWYELDQLFNCTFPHVLENNTFIWCNQGALCVYDGINDTMWTEYGLLEKVSETSGSIFNNFANWAIADNNTKVFYETWTVYNSSDALDKYRIMYFDSFDCASWVLRAFDQLYGFGAKFNTSIQLNYTRLNLYSDEPTLIGNYSTIFNGNNQTLINDVRKFYRSFQRPEKDPLELLEQIMDVYTFIKVDQRFYFYFNDLYWYLHLKEPFIHITYNYIPLPGTKDNLIH